MYTDLIAYTYGLRIAVFADHVAGHQSLVLVYVADILLLENVKYSESHVKASIRLRQIKLSFLGHHLQSKKLPLPKFYRGKCLGCLDSSHGPGFWFDMAMNHETSAAELLVLLSSVSADAPSSYAHDNLRRQTKNQHACLTHTCRVISPRSLHFIYSQFSH